MSWDWKRWKHSPKQLSNAHDPTVALTLITVGVVGVGAVVTVGAKGWSIPDALTVFGGVIVLLGSYFAARTLREGELDKATQMLASESAAVRLAGVCRLWKLAGDTPRYVDYVTSVLSAYLSDSQPSEPGNPVAYSALEKLSRSPKPHS